MSWLWLVMGLAVAQDVPADSTVNEAPVLEEVDASALSQDLEQVDAEITVWGEPAIRDAQAAILREMKSLGWKPQDRRRSDGSVVFRPPSRWMGKAFLSPDGLISFGRPIVAFNEVSPAGSGYDADLQLDNDYATPSAEAKLYILPKKDKLDAVHAQVVEALHPLLQAYADVISETRFRTYLEELPDRLDALWTDGVPLEGQETAVTMEDRRRAVLHFWADRVDSPEGNRVAEAVEKWLRFTVQESDTPLTDEDRSWALEQADGRRTFDRL